MIIMYSCWLLMHRCAARDMSEPEHLRRLRRAIVARKATIGVFGAGYVGLPLACAFAEARFRTIAGDKDLTKIRAIRQGRSYVEDDYVRRRLPSLIKSGALRAEEDADHLALLADVTMVTVPTPLNDRKEPDLSSVVSVTETIAKQLRPGKLFVLESSVYPGATDEVVKPILERGGLRAGQDFCLAHSPERIDYNNPKHSILKIPKVVGGATPLCTKIACELYSKVLDAQVVPVSSIRTAEATKMLENAYRYVNIALVNELAILHEKLGIDFFEVVAAASTKPFGFQPFYPGPGVGGHCIPKDPHYLSYAARQVGLDLRLLELSAEINDGMVMHIVDRLKTALAAQGKSLQGSKVALLGLAFKADVSDSRRSPSIALANHLADLGAELSVYDPLVRGTPTGDRNLISATDLETAVENAEILILATPHTAFREIDLKRISKRMQPEATVVDTRGFWTPAECKSVGLRYIGLGRP